MRNAMRFVVGIGLVLALVGTAEARPRRRRPPPDPEPVAEPAQVEPAPTTTTTTAPPTTTTPAPTTPAPTGTGTPATTSPSPTTAPTTTATPTTTTPPPATPPGQLDFRDPPPMPDLTAVRDEIDAIMDELVETRARVAAVGRELFDTRVRIHVYIGREQMDAGVTLAVRLDGLGVYAAEPGEAEEGRQIFEGYAAPGPHVLQIVTERRASADDDYRASQADTFRFELARGKMHDISILLDDRSDIAEDFAEEGEGAFDLRTRVRVQTMDIERAR
jgi:hypothetical protein